MFLNSVWFAVQELREKNSRVHKRIRGGHQAHGLDSQAILWIEIWGPSNSPKKNKKMDTSLHLYHLKISPNMALLNPQM